MDDVFRCSRCSRFYWEANQLDIGLNICLTVAVLTLGCVSAWYWSTSPTSTKASVSIVSSP
jgi:hypothetical protein